MKPGAIITEPGSTVKNKTGGWRVFRPVFDMERCIDCGNCWIFCPESCVSRSEEGEYSADLDYCKGCGICANECPTEAIRMELEEK